MKAFYEDNPLRRGDDVYLAAVSDGELRWKVCWLPRTLEVVAWADAWVDDYWHRRLVGGLTYANKAGPSKVPILAPAVVPQLICLLGLAESAEYARTALNGASTPAECRSRLTP